jgi:type VI secretion system secreted protein VgrG
VGLKVDETADTFEQLELYDYPGEYSIEKRGNDLAKIRLEETRLFMDRAEGKSDCPNFVPGFTFKLTGHELKSHNQEYLLTETFHTGIQAQTSH